MQTTCNCTRRSFLAESGMGLFGLALGAMLQREAGATEPRWTPPDGQPHFAPKAKSVIWLFMNGGVSHMEIVRPQADAQRYAGKSIAETPFADVQNPGKLNRTASSSSTTPTASSATLLSAAGRLLASTARAASRSATGCRTSAGCIDDLAVVRSMCTTDDNHGAQTQFHSGRHMLDGEFPTARRLGPLRPRLAQRQPAAVHLDGQARVLERTDGHYLGPAHDAVPLRVDPATPLDYGRPETDRRQDEQAIGFDLVNRLNRESADRYPRRSGAASAHPVVRARLPHADVGAGGARLRSARPQETQQLYGLDQPRLPRHSACSCWRRAGSSSAACASSRFSTAPAGPGRGTPTAACGRTTATTARRSTSRSPGLLKDLKRRGLLDETLVVFATEFGRTPGTQGGDGRDHHIYGFSVWMAGGGIKAGVVHGATDEIGFHAVENRHYVTDIHATILHQLGLDSHRLEIPGRKRLEIDHGTPIREIIA